MELVTGTKTIPMMTCCWCPSPGLASGGEIGVGLFFEVAQQLLFAQQSILHRCSLGAFERMQEAAGSWSGLTNIASTTANRMGAVLRMQNI